MTKRFSILGLLFCNLFVQIHANAQDWKNERWKLEIQSTTLFPTQRSVKGGSFFGTGAGFSSTSYPKFSGGVELNSSFTTTKRPIGKSAWFAELNIGAGLESLFLTNDVELYEYAGFIFEEVPPTFYKFQSRTSQLTAFVDNILLFSKNLKKLEIGIGLNFRCLYTFYNYTKRDGTSQTVGKGELSPYTESGADLWDLGFWLDNSSSLSYTFQGVLTVKPIVLRGFYATIRLPLHPVSKASSYSANFYGFSIGMGYRFSSN